MDVDFIVGLARGAVELTIFLAMPMLGVGLLVGLVVSVFQAATQIQEMTLTFIPKIIAVLAALIIFAPWLLEKLNSYTINLINNIPGYIK